MKSKATIFISIIFIFVFVFNTFPVKSKNSPSRSKHISDQKDNQPQYIPGQIRLKFKQEAEQIKSIKDNATITGIASVDEKISNYQVQSIQKSFKHKPIPKDTGIADISKIYTLHFAEDKDIHQVAKSFSIDPNIEYAEPVAIYYLELAPDDPQFAQQNHLPQIFMPEAWDISRGDSNVIIAIVDGGTDWEHIDLIDNIWTNQAEANGSIGIDDDANGYVDDIHGWDFANDDNNPTNQPTNLVAYYHGTVTAGLASARTNNATQVTGASWNCTIMPLKHGRDNVERSIYNWENGAIYAAENGADVINLSFGSFREPSQSAQDVIDYVYGLGAVVVASAGNELNSDPNHYPSGYHNVLSVTWINNADYLTTDSPYGLSVDVAAPGVQLLSTSPNDETLRMSGSSSAAPIVSGLAALIKSQHPDWGPTEIMRQIFLTADNIDNLNPQYAGKLGSGRINAYRAVTETNPAELAPRLKLIGDVAISDSSGGDNDNIFEQGETIEVKASAYRNYSISPGMNVVFTITSDDTDLTINNGTYNFGYFPPDMELSVPLSFSFTVNNNAKGKTANLFVGWQSDGGYSGADTFKIIIGKIPILIVDDDFDADDIEFPDAEKFYTNLLDTFKLNYAVWDRYELGALGPDQMTNFPIVIWLCAWAFPSLDSADQLAISNFLDNGGSLFITGQDIGWDFNDPGGFGYQQREFYAKYLHAIYFADDSPVNEVVGIPGDPIGDSMEFSVWQPGLTEENQYPDEIEPDSGATAVFEYAGGNNHKFGIKYKGDHKVVYFGMGLEAIDSKENTPPGELSEIRTEIFGRVLNWLNFIDHEPLTDTENSTDSRTVMAHVTNSSATTDLVSMELYWRKTNQSTFTAIPMTHTGNNKYSAEIPGSGKNTTIEYYIKMVNSYYAWSSPQDAPQNYYNYRVGPDQIAPTFSHLPLKSSINGEMARAISVGVEDNIELDDSAVYVRYYSSKLPPDSVKLTEGDNPGLFQGLIPAVFDYGDTVSYYFSGYDKATSPNRGQSEIYSIVVGLENFESGLSDWIASPEDGWGLDQSQVHAGKISINDSPNQTPYPLNRDVSIAINFGMDLSGTDFAALRFWTKYFLEINHDYGYIEVSNDGGQTWNQVGDSYNGATGAWTLKIVDLNSYCGPGNTDVRFRFRMVSDANQGPPFAGWFIDDVQIVEGVEFTRITGDINTAIPKDFVLYQNYPNPFNPNTTIRFDLPTPGKVIAKIYNIKGELVRTLFQSQMNAGSFMVQWDGRDDNGQNLTSGVYFFKLSTANFSATRKLLMIK